MAPKDCPLGKGGILNALHMLQGAHPYVQEEEAEVAKRGKGHTKEYCKVRTLE